MANTPEHMRKVSKGTRFKKNGLKAINAGKKGGLSKSPKKALSARVRFMKEQGYNDKQIDKTLQIMDDPQLSILDMREYVDQIKELVKDDPAMMDKVGKHYETLHKLHHGEKKQIDIRSVNINLNADEAMTEKFMGDLKEHFGDE